MIFQLVVFGFTVLNFAVLGSEKDPTVHNLLGQQLAGEHSRAFSSSARYFPQELEEIKTELEYLDSADSIVGIKKLKNFLCALRLKIVSKNAPFAFDLATYSSSQMFSEITLGFFRCIFVNHSEELQLQSEKKNGLFGVENPKQEREAGNIYTFPNAVVPVPEAGPSGGARSETNLNEYELCRESKQRRVG